MGFSRDIRLGPDPDDFHVYSSTIGRPPSPAVIRAREIYLASVLRRIESRRRRRQLEEGQDSEAS